MSVEQPPLELIRPPICADITGLMSDDVTKEVMVGIYDPVYRNLWGDGNFPIAKLMEKFVRDNIICGIKERDEVLNNVLRALCH